MENLTMNQSKRIKVTDVNPFLICVLCGGYYIDATTIIECLHSFCRSCIVKYLEKNKYCPICDVQVHKSNPLLNIRNDKTLQTIVYKLVPSLFQNEMQRRLDFYKTVEVSKKPTDPESRGEVGPHSSIILPDETVSICLEYVKSPTSTNSQSFGKRYLHCPGAVTISHLHRILMGKFSLTRRHTIQIYFKDDLLPDSLSLIDLAYTYQWRRKGPIHLNYRILELRRKWLKKNEVIKKEVKTETKEEEKKVEWKEVSVEINENGVLSVKGIESISTAVSNLVRNSELEVVPLDPDDNKTRMEANKLSISRMIAPKGEALNRIVSKLSPNERLIGNTSVSIRAVPVSPPNPSSCQQVPSGPPPPPRPSPVLSSVSLLKQVPTQNSVVVGNVTVSKEAPSNTRDPKDIVPRVSVTMTKETPLPPNKPKKFKYKALHWNPSIDRHSILKQVDAKRTHKIFKSRNVLPYLPEDGVKALYRVGEMTDMVSRCRPPPYAPGSPKRPLISPPAYISRIPSPAHAPSPVFSPLPHFFSRFPLPESFPPPDLLRSIFYPRGPPMLPPPVQHVPPSPKASPQPLPHPLTTPTPPSTTSMTSINNNNNNNISSPKEFSLKPPTNPIPT